MNIINVGIIGSRKRNGQSDKQLIIEELKKLLKLYNNIKIISGGASKGADKFAEEIASEFNIPIQIFYPKLDNIKNRFDMIQRYYDRNKKIAEESDILIACVSPDRKGGTENTINYYLKNKNKLIII